MTEYIEKDLIYKKVAEMEELARNRYLDTPSNSPVYARYLAQLQERTSLKFFIAEIPAADVAPVRHGRWTFEAATENTLSRIKCNICGWWTLDPSVDGVYKYCPNCGAKMDADTQEREKTK